MKQAIKAIETRYKGYRFRSRLEARWAVFFDALGWSWEYEPEGFDLGFGELYLPDFLVGGEFVEIKATPPTEAEKRKAMLLSQGSGRCVVFGVGLPEPYMISNGLPGFTPEDQTFRDGVLSYNAYCLGKWKRPGLYLGDTPCDEDLAACNAARSARFEHGECGVHA